MGFVQDEMHRKAILIALKFKHLFSLYSVCHLRMNGKTVYEDDKDIDSLGKLKQTNDKFVYSDFILFILRVKNCYNSATEHHYLKSI